MLVNKSFDCFFLFFFSGKTYGRKLLNYITLMLAKKKKKTDSGDCLKVKEHDVIFFQATGDD